MGCSISAPPPTALHPVHPSSFYHPSVTHTLPLPAALVLTTSVSESPDRPPLCTSTPGFTCQPERHAKTQTILLLCTRLFSGFLLSSAERTWTSVCPHHAHMPWPCHSSFIACDSLRPNLTWQFRMGHFKPPWHFWTPSLYWIYPSCQHPLSFEYHLLCEDIPEIPSVELTLLSDVEMVLEKGSDHSRSQMKCDTGPLS